MSTFGAISLKFVHILNVMGLMPSLRHFTDHDEISHARCSSVVVKISNNACRVPRQSSQYILEYAVRRHILDSWDRLSCLSNTHGVTIRPQLR